MAAAGVVAASYALFLALLAYAAAGAPPRAPATRGRDVVLTVVGGYAAFVVIVAAFAPIAGLGWRDVLRSAVPQGAVLAAVATAAFALAAAATALLRRGRTSA